MQPKPNIYSRMKRKSMDSTESIQSQISSAENRSNTSSTYVTPRKSESESGAGVSEKRCPSPSIEKMRWQNDEQDSPPKALEKQQRMCNTPPLCTPLISASSSVNCDHIDKKVKADSVRSNSITNEANSIDADGSPSPLASNWIVRNESLRTIPSFYPLPATSCFIEDAQPGTAVAISSRVSDCLRMYSIAAVYDNEDASARAKTQDGIALTIRLFKGGAMRTSCNDFPFDCDPGHQEDTNIGTAAEGIIVEIQHCHGCPIGFHHICRAIFAAAKGMSCNGLGHVEHKGETYTASPKPSLHVRSSSHKPQKMELTLSDAPQNIGREDGVNHHKNIVFTLEKVIEMLDKDRIDANKLGMELLSFLTDSSQVRDPDAVYASHVVLLGDDREGGKDNSSFDVRIHQRVLAHVLQHQGEKSPDIDEDDISLHTHGLAIVRNSLKVMVETGAIGESHHQKISSSFVQKIMPVFLRELRNAKQRPHEACLSASCLGSLLELSTDARNAASSAWKEYVAALDGAYKHGVSAHASLANESNRSLSILKSYTELEAAL